MLRLIECNDPVILLILLVKVDICLFHCSFSSIITPRNFISDTWFKECSSKLIENVLFKFAFDLGETKWINFDLDMFMCR